MPSWLADVPIADAPQLIISAGLAVSLVVVVVLVRRRIRLMPTIVGALIGGATGFALTWTLTQIVNLFDVSLSPTSYAWITAGFAGVGALLPSIFGGRARRRVAGAAGVVVCLLAAALGVNADFGQYTTVGSLFDSAIAGQLPATIAAAQEAGAPGPGSNTPGSAKALWRGRASSSTPRHGLVAAVTIPGVRSHFPARTAYLYLPPAALLPHPRQLPVLVMLSGQPGSPQNVMQSGRMASIMDAYAQVHHGLAPIVVVPDQLGSAQANPMCVDSALGDSATYLTVDVPDWIRTHLAVEPRTAAWAIGGFSQGGTCSIQLGSAHPRLFGNIIDVSGQVAPRNGNSAQTIIRGFRGDSAAYRAALPSSLLSSHAPYRDEVAVFGVGSLDSRYGPESASVASDARAAGMTVSRSVSPGTAHDWHTVQWVLTHGIAPIMHHLGLAA